MECKVTTATFTEEVDSYEDIESGLFFILNHFLEEGAPEMVFFLGYAAIGWCGVRLRLT